ncbi:MAG TPA: hypothetical protein VI410_00480 [Anaerolineales bacterium]|nr:hypothetical protein [Anaerolineales bacterium]
MALKIHPSLFAPSLLLVAAACSPSPAAPALTETPAPASTPAYFADAATLQALDPEDTMYQHRVTLGDPTDPRAVLHIAFKAASEDRQISPTGMAGGELFDRGSMLLLGEELRVRPWWPKARTWQWCTCVAGSTAGSWSSGVVCNTPAAR